MDAIIILSQTSKIQTSVLGLIVHHAQWVMVSNFLVPLDWKRLIVFINLWVNLAYFPLLCHFYRLHARYNRFYALIKNLSIIKHKQPDSDCFIGLTSNNHLLMHICPYPMLRGNPLYD